MGHEKLGRQRAVLEVKDALGRLRVFAASCIKIDGDEVSFKWAGASKTCSRIDVKAAIEVDSGFAVPSLSRYGADGKSRVHDRQSFLQALELSLRQADAVESDLCIIFGHVLQEGSDPERCRDVVCDLQRHLRWYDLVALLDDNTVAVLLPECDQKGAASVIERLVQTVAAKHRELKIVWSVSHAQSFTSASAN